MYPKQQLYYMIAFIALFVGSVILLLIQNSKISDLENIKEETVKVWLAKHDIKEGDKITSRDLYPMEFPKANIYFRRLDDSEILGKYAKTILLANEPIRYEKIAKVYKRKNTEGVKKKDKDESTLLVKSNFPSEIQPKYDVYTAKTSMFKNINFFIKANDKIDIIAVWPDNIKDDINVRYIASNVKVLGFTANGEFQYDYKKEIISKDRREVTIADEIVLDLRPKEITNLLKLYYRGKNIQQSRLSPIRSNSKSESIENGQLWIVSVAASQNNRSLSREKQFLKYNTYIKKTNSESKKSNKKVTVEYE